MLPVIGISCVPSGSMHLELPNTTAYINNEFKMYFQT
ncbi:hypothetical protein ACX52_4310 [Yersinia pestis]|nr:hypothetical protein ACX52_4310 [Yersinia pestis]